MKMLDVKQIRKGAGMTLLDYYEKLGDASVAEAVYIATACQRSRVTIRTWVSGLKAGQPLPDWVEGAMPAILRALETRMGGNGQ